MKVLVADDSLTMRAVLQQLLDRQGYQVVAAHDGIAAWDSLTKGDIRLAILDWMMPGMDGVDICRKLQESHRHSLIYVILLTSKTGGDNIVEALHAGASDYLTKPFQPEELFARLRVGERITKLQLQLSQQEKLEAIGRLASGIAHEINTPMQFVGDNTRFLGDAFGNLKKLFDSHGALLAAARTAGVQGELVRQVEQVHAEVDADYLLGEIPSAIQQTLDGVERVARIVRAMKEFSHPGADDEKTLVDINKAVENAVTVCRSEWKYVAEVVKELDPALPPAHCIAGALNQALLNIIVNAAQAIADVAGAHGGRKGTITLSTRREGSWTEIRISDTGTGIPEEIRHKIFDPFFTTKGVGRGTGQGLAIAHSVVVDKHRGTLSFETEVGQGTTFIVRLPSEGGPQPGTA